MKFNVLVEYRSAVNFDIIAQDMLKNLIFAYLFLIPKPYFFSGLLLYILLFCHEQF